MGVALAEAFPAAREVFEEVDEAAKASLFRLCREGPEEELRRTINAQPALMAVSMAVIRVLQREGGWNLAAKARFAAGHSLGEYSALAAAGALALADAARLLRRRGQVMQEAVPEGKGAMAALLGIDCPAAEEVARIAQKETGKGVCEVANDNAPGQVVISGTAQTVEAAGRIARDKGARRAIPLPVSAPFHCRLMAPAAEAMSEALAQTPIHRPELPVVANISARPVEEPEAIRESLIRQIAGRVRWRESVAFMAQAGVTHLVEAGAGQVLTAMTRRIDKNLTARPLNSPADIETFLKEEA